MIQGIHSLVNAVHQQIQNCQVTMLLPGAEVDGATVKQAGIPVQHKTLPGTLQSVDLETARAMQVAGLSTQIAGHVITVSSALWFKLDNSPIQLNEPFKLKINNQLYEPVALPQVTQSGICRVFCV